MGARTLRIVSSVRGVCMKIPTLTPLLGPTYSRFQRRERRMVFAKGWKEALMGKGLAPAKAL